MPDGSLPLRGIVLVTRRDVYGVTLIYPENDLARSILELTRQRTFTQAAIDTCKRMGLRVLTNGTDPKEL